VDVIALETLPVTGFGLGVGVNVAGKLPSEGAGRERDAVLPPLPNGVDMGMAANGSAVAVAVGVSVGGIGVDVGVTSERNAAPRMGGLVTTTNAMSGTRTNKKALLDMHPSPDGESETRRFRIGCSHAELRSSTPGCGEQPGYQLSVPRDGHRYMLRIRPNGPVRNLPILFACTQPAYRRHCSTHFSVCG